MFARKSLTALSDGDGYGRRNGTSWKTSRLNGCRSCKENEEPKWTQDRNTMKKKVRLPKVSEKEFMSQVIALAKLRGWRVAHFRTARVQRADGKVYYATPVQADGEGFPDLIMVRKAKFLAVELKVPPNSATDSQAAWIVDLRNAGADARIWYPKDWDEIVKTLCVMNE